MQNRSRESQPAPQMLSKLSARASNTWCNLHTLATPAQTRPLAPSRRTPVSLWLLLVLLATSYAGYVSKLGALGLTGPDEPRYASIARNMAETNDWVTPRLDGKPWFEKPILYYWEAAVSFRVLGENDYAARFPSALAAILAAAAMCWIAWRFYSAATTVLVLLLMPTTIGIIGFGHAATPDMTFAAMLRRRDGAWRRNCCRLPNRAFFIASDSDSSSDLPRSRKVPPRFCSPEEPRFFGEL